VFVNTGISLVYLLAMEFVLFVVVALTMAMVGFGIVKLLMKTVDGIVYLAKLAYPIVTSAWFIIVAVEVAAAYWYFS